MIKVILFDWFGVLGTPSGMNWFRKHTKDFDGEKEAVVETFNRFDLGKIDGTAMTKGLADIVGVSEEGVWDELYDEAEVNTQVLRIAKRLKERYTTGIFSNVNTEFIDTIFDAHSVRDCLKNMVLH